MITTTIFPGRYVQGYNTLKRLGIEMSRFGQKGFVICDPFVFDHLLPDFRQNMEQAIEIKVERFGGECSDEEIGRLADLARKADSELIVGIGGGKTLDTAKVFGFRYGRRIGYLV